MHDPITTGDAAGHHREAAPMTDTPPPAADLHAVLYVLITPDGELLTRVADGRAHPDQWGGVYQDLLWQAVAAAVDPHRRLVNGIALDHGLWARVADVSPAAAATIPDLYPPNPASWATLTALGAPAQPWHGTVAITGVEDTTDGLTTSLTRDQIDLITRTHQRAHRPHQDGRPGRRGR
ncbi:hypothetical protein ACQPW3_21205 [Actinosynnema sp. CA-248983]